MILWILFLVGLVLFRSSYTLKTISDSYILKDNSDAVRGLFILLILASHFSGYVPAYTQPIDMMYWKIRVFLGQLVVCMFLFYSGYGVTLSFAEKGEAYRRNFPRRRILSTLLVFDLSLLFYYAVQRKIGKTYTLPYYLKAMLGWESIGNSNWYMVAILGLYVVSWLTAIYIGQAKKAPLDGYRTAALLFIGTIAFAQILRCAGKPDPWMNTIICYPLGGLYYYVRPRFEELVRKKRTYYICLFATLAAFYLAHAVWMKHIVLYSVTSMLFTVLVVLITMKLEIRSKTLGWAGKHLNDIYLTHRIPMILLGQVSFIKSRIHLYFALSVIAALVCAFLFNRLVAFLSGKYTVRKA